MASPRLELSSLPSACSFERSGSTDSGLDSPTQDETDGAFHLFTAPTAREPSSDSDDDLSRSHDDEDDEEEETGMQDLGMPARPSDEGLPPADEQAGDRPDVYEAPGRDARLPVRRGSPGALPCSRREPHAAAAAPEQWGPRARRAPIALGPDEPDPTACVDCNDPESCEDPNSWLGSPVTNSNVTADLLNDSGFHSALGGENTEDSVADQTNQCSREVKRLSLYKKDASAEREPHSSGSHTPASSQSAPHVAAAERAVGGLEGAGSSPGHGGQQSRARLAAVSPLRTETAYDQQTRASLEQARVHVSQDIELMTQRVTKLSHQLKVNQEHQRNLTSELAKKTSMMQEYANINSTLQDTTIDLQRALTNSTLSNCRLQEEVRSLGEENARGLRELHDCEAHLRSAQRRSQTLQLQVEACQAANEIVIRETTSRLYGEYYAQMAQQENQHRTQIDAFLARQTEYEARLQQADTARGDMERTLADSRQRVRELERLLSGLQNERELFLMRQEELETDLSLMEARPSGSQDEQKRYEKLEGEMASLNEKIRHLNGIIISQDRKIKGVLEKVENLQWELQQKDALITTLQQKVATLEAENVELKRRLEEQSHVVKTSQRSTPNVSIPAYQPHLPVLTRRQWSLETSSDSGDSPLARLRKLRASRGQPGPGSKEAERHD